MKVLIAGTGSIGLRHIKNIQRLDGNAQFLFLRQSERHDELSRDLGAEVISSLEFITKDNVDCAIVATPSALHSRLIVELIKLNIPMYIEKPVVTKMQDIGKVYDALKYYEYKKATLVGCNLRFLPSLIKVKEMLSSQVIGNVVRASFQAAQWLPDWRPNQDYTQSYSANPELGGGVVMDLIHELDAARWLLGEFDNVQAFVSSCPSLQIQSEAVACIIMRGKLTPLVSINLDYVSRRPIRRYEFVGDEGTIIWDLVEKSLVIYNKDGVNKIDGGKDGFDVGKTYEMAMLALFSAIKNNGVLEQDIYEGLQSVELALKVKGEVTS